MELKTIFHTVAFIGWLIIIWRLYDLVDWSAKYMKEKTRQLKEKTVCDTCFTLLKAFREPKNN